jgi:predicted dehydrogenase
MEDLDLVCVCTPPEFHEEMTMAAIECGHHIFCTKPLARSAAEGRRLRDEAHSRGEVNVMDFGRRYAPERRYFRELVRSGFLGELRFVSTTVFVELATDPTQAGHYDNWLSRRPHGGILHASLLNHHLDLLRYTFGELHDVQGRSTTLIGQKPVLSAKYDSRYEVGDTVETVGLAPVDAEDAAVICGRFENGAPLSVAGTWSVYHGSGERLEAYGSEGTLVLESTGQILGATADALELAELPVPDGDAAASRAQGRPALTSPALYSQLAADVAGMILGTQHDAPFATFDDGVRLLEIGEAVMGSTRGSRRDDK